MQNKEFNMVTSDGTFLVGRLWKPSVSPHSVICLVHGIGEHSGRYDNWARRFNEQGVMVYALDLRGHGLSEGKRGHIIQLSDFMNDIDSLVRRVKYNWSELPIFLYGHSMGGNLVLNFILRKRFKLAGGIISSPWLKLVHPPSSIMLKGAQWADYFMPALRLKTGIRSTQLSSEKEVQEQKEHDPLVHDKISLRLFLELSKGANEIISRANRITIPMFFAHGTEDDITDLATTRQVADKVSGPSVFLPVEGARHEIHNEPGADNLFTSINGWMKQICNPELKKEHA
ncbi:alpha/beta hydrolase [Thermophagus xiamenensis]|uniref:Lysophospholipase, alpha-beta hydrolase superfamily n=1 Tax=Thermophagus xiamenensis TaxID=385682 RepID=A0A1I1Y412_9BACT|nr:alpha/beta hydrolase [Thermophagus xiamenensis]SFE14304.1 Lysophospholipase, alpha-beta hydrolase superfamily [Thermophagus xiamenensis]